MVEWIAGHLLEKKRITHTRWWDYSGRRWNLDSYICVSASVCGAFRAPAIQWGNPLLVWLYGLLPPAWSARFLSGCSLGLLVIDALGSALAPKAEPYIKLPRWRPSGNRLEALADADGALDCGGGPRESRRAHPEAQSSGRGKRKNTVFTQGCSF